MPSFGNRCGAVLDPNALAALNALLRRQRRCWQDIQQQQPPPGQQQQQHQQQQQPPGQQHEAEHKASQVFRDAIDVNTDVLAIVRARKRQRLAAEAAGAASPLLPLPKRYRKVSSQETAQDREHLQALLKDAQHCVSLLTQSASDAANGSAGAGAGAQRLRNDTDGVAGHDDDRDDRDAQAELHITSQTLAVNRPQTLEQLAVLLCQLARSSCNTADGAGCPVPDSLLVALPDDDCLAVMQQTLGGQEPPKAGMELSDESSGRMARWLLLDKFAALDRAPGRTLASAFRIAAKTRPQPTMEALVIHLLSLYADRKAIAMTETLCKLVKESTSLADRLYLLRAIIEPGAHTRLALDQDAIPLLDLLPNNAGGLTADAITEEHVDAMVAFLQAFDPAVRQSATKYSAALLGLCTALTPLAPKRVVSDASLRALEQLAADTTTFLRRRLTALAASLVSSSSLSSSLSS